MRDLTTLARAYPGAQVSQTTNPTPPARQPSLPKEPQPGSGTSPKRLGQNPPGEPHRGQSITGSTPKNSSPPGPNVAGTKSPAVTSPGVMPTNNAGHQGTPAPPGTTSKTAPTRAPTNLGTGALEPPHAPGQSTATPACRGWPAAPACTWNPRSKPQKCRARACELCIAVRLS